jgi:xanthine dehydrogenase accessory factor
VSNSFENYIDCCHKLIGSKKSFVAISIVDVKGSSPGNLGAKIIASKNGIEFGSIGGGKLEAFALNEAKNIILNKRDATNLKNINLQKDIGMNCGGEVTLVFEPYLLSKEWKIVLFGAGHVSQALSRVLLKLNCALTIFDSRPEWLDKLPNDTKLTKICRADMSCEILNIDPASFICLMTMGSQTDLPILNEALKKDFPFIGMIGSTVKRKSIEQELVKLGHSNDNCNKFICPIGEQFGSNDPEEVSLSIAAQLLKLR